MIVFLAVLLKDSESLSSVQAFATLISSTPSRNLFKGSIYESRVRLNFKTQELLHASSCQHFQKSADHAFLPQVSELSVRVGRAPEHLVPPSPPSVSIPTGSPIGEQIIMAADSKKAMQSASLQRESPPV